MIKNIVFDMGNVLLEWVPENIVKRFVDDPERVEKLAKTIFESEIWHKFDANEVTGEDVRNYAKNSWAKITLKISTKFWIIGNIACPFKTV